MDFDDENDPLTRAAILESLRDVHGLRERPSYSSQLQNRAVVDLTDESDDKLVQTPPKLQSAISADIGEENSYNEDADLKRAIELSLQSSEDVVDMTEESRDLRPEPIPKHAPVESKAGTPPMGLFGLDRKQMEEERILRLAKRKAEGPLLDEPRVARPRINASPQRRSFGSAAAISDRSSSSQAKCTPESRVTQSQIPSDRPGIQFPTGTVKKTWAAGYPRLGDDIKIEEVFQQSTLELAVLSSFVWDMEWLFSKLDLRARFLLIMQAKEEKVKRKYESETVNMPNLRLCFPPMDGQVNCMHSKLMLLFHPGYVRIVVPTANLLPIDWGEQGGLMENSVFIMDLPKKADQSSTKSSKVPFYEELVYFLNASTVPKGIIARLDHFDFGGMAHLAFIHSMWVGHMQARYSLTLVSGGSHINDAWKRTGHCGLGRAVNSLGLRSSGALSIDFVTSSLGSLTNEFLRSIYLAAQGDSGLTELTLRTAKSFPAIDQANSSRHIEKSSAAEWKDRFRVYFPSESTVRESKGCGHGAGTICFQEKWFGSERFPRHVLRDCLSRRPGLLMHNKIMYVRPDEPITLSDSSQCRAWAYVGSANLSESAWGRLVQDKSTKQPKLNCRNWECGVLIPVIASISNGQPQHHVGSNSVQDDGESLHDVFRETVPVPVQSPGRKLGPGLKPWFSGF